MARKIGVVMQKGGVAKTTTAVNLAATLAARGFKTLFIDYDPQGDASRMFGLSSIIEDPATWGSAQFTMGEGGFQPRRGIFPNLDVIPATEDLAFVEPDLYGDLVSSPRRLAAALAPVESSYDYIIVDSGPNLGILSLNVIVACPEILVPVKLEPVCIPGALRLNRHLAQLQRTLTPQTHILGVVGTFFVENRDTPRAVLATLSDLFGEGVLFDTRIHAAQAIADSGGTSTPIVIGQPGNRGAIEYDRLVDEILARGASARAA